MKKLIPILCLFALMANAKEVFEANNGDTISVKISSKNLTRIEIEGQKIMTDYTSADVSKKITKPLGQVYLVPNTSHPFNLYIVSETGNTYNLHLIPSKHANGDSIVIKPAASKFGAASKLVFNDQSYVRNINFLLQIMYLNKDNDGGYNVTPMHQPLDTFDGLGSVLYRTYSNNILNGEVILIKNLSKSKILLTEGQFFSDHTLAISIEKPELQPNEITRIFIVKEASL